MFTDRDDFLKALTRRLINKAGRLKNAAIATDIALSTLSNAQNANKTQRSHWLTLQEVDLLEQAIGEPVITGRLANEYREGHQPIPHNTHITTSNLLTLSNRIKKEMLEDDEATEMALRDGVVSDNELAMLIKESEDVVRAAEKRRDWLCGVMTARRRKKEEDNAVVVTMDREKA